MLGERLLADRRDWPDPTLVPCYLLLGESGCCSKRSRETFSRCAPAVAIDHLKSGRLRDGHGHLRRGPRHPVRSEVTLLPL